MSQPDGQTASNTQPGSVKPPAHKLGGALKLPRVWWHPPLWPSVWLFLYTIGVGLTLMIYRDESWGFLLPMDYFGVALWTGLFLLVASSTYVTFRGYLRLVRRDWWRSVLIPAVVLALLVAVGLGGLNVAEALVVALLGTLTVLFIQRFLRRADDETPFFESSSGGIGGSMGGWRFSKALLDLAVSIVFAMLLALVVVVMAQRSGDDSSNPLAAEGKPAAEPPGDQAKPSSAEPATGSEPAKATPQTADGDSASTTAPADAPEGSSEDP